MRQTKLSFNLLVGATSLSGIVGLAGAELFMSKKLSEGAVTTEVG
ncbi:TRADD-N-associated membrane domain-containing protein [Moorena producens]